MIDIPSQTKLLNIYKELKLKYISYGEKKIRQYEFMYFSPNGLLADEFVFRGYVTIEYKYITIHPKILDVDLTSLEDFDIM